MPASIAIVVGSKGRGSNMAALLTAIALRPELARVECIVTPRSGTPAAERAREAGLEVRIAPTPADLLPALHGSDVVLLAGYALLVPSACVRAFAG
ncbi:MAG: hypothetical protein C4320_05290, partial [Armatimonadota bacterium]